MLSVSYKCSIQEIPRVLGTFVDIPWSSASQRNSLSGSRCNAPSQWLAKVLYSLKIWLFCGQFKMSNREEKGIREIAAFGVVVYLKAWITAPLALISN